MSWLSSSGPNLSLKRGPRKKRGHLAKTLGTMNISALLVLASSVWVQVSGGMDVTVDQLNEIRANLMPFVINEASKRHQRLEELSSYSFQFQGRSVLGNNIVYISASCERLPSDASTEFLVVFDGG